MQARPKKMEKGVVGIGGLLTVLGSHPCSLHSALLRPSPLPCPSSLLIRPIDQTNYVIKN